MFWENYEKLRNNDNLEKIAKNLERIADALEGKKDEDSKGNMD